MYIRTKDGVYEVVGFDEECIIPSPLIKVKNEYGKERITHCCKDDIINQSENLEELCDKFVYCQNGFYEMYSKLDFAHYDKEYIKNGGTIKGAIWTDKGLTYVAKMNESGCLELI